MTARQRITLRFARWISRHAGSVCAWAWSKEPEQTCPDCDNGYRGVDDCPYCLEKADTRDRWEYEADTRAEHEAMWG